MKKIIYVILTLLFSLFIFPKRSGYGTLEFEKNCKCFGFKYSRKLNLEYQRYYCFGIPFSCNDYDYRFQRAMKSGDQIFLSKNKINYESDKDKIKLGIINDYDKNKLFKIYITEKAYIKNNTKYSFPFDTNNWFRYNNQLLVEKHNRSITPIHLTLPENIEKGMYIFKLKVLTDNRTYGGEHFLYIEKD